MGIENINDKQKVCPFMALPAPGKLQGQINFITSPCLEKNCMIYNESQKACGLSSGVKNVKKSE